MFTVLVYFIQPLNNWTYESFTDGRTVDADFSVFFSVYKLVSQCCRYSCFSIRSQQPFAARGSIVSCLTTLQSYFAILWYRPKYALCRKRIFSATLEHNDQVTFAFKDWLNSSGWDAPTELFSLGAFAPIATDKSAPIRERININ